MCVQSCVCMHVCACMCVHACVCNHVCACMCVQSCVCVHVCVQSCVCMHVCVHACVRMCDMFDNFFFTYEHAVMAAVIREGGVVAIDYVL